MSVRAGPNYVMNERRYSRESAILRSFDALITQKKPTYLFTGYLTKSARLASDRALMFQITLGVRVPLFEINRAFWFDEHFEGFMYEEQITLAIRSESIRYGFSQKHGIGNAVHLADERNENGHRTIKVPVGTALNARPGFQGYLEISVDDWR